MNQKSELRFCIDLYLWLKFANNSKVRKWLYGKYRNPDGTIKGQEIVDDNKKTTERRMGKRGRFWRLWYGITYHFRGYWYNLFQNSDIGPGYQTDKFSIYFKTLLKK